MKELSDIIEEDFGQKSPADRVCIIVDSYFYLSEAKLNNGEQLPEHLKEQFSVWLNSPRLSAAKDAVMMQAIMEECVESCSAAEHMQEACYPIGEVSEMLDVPQSTIQMWVNRLSVLTPWRNDYGCLTFSAKDVGRIGKVRRLIRIGGMTFHDIIKHIIL